MALTSGDLRIDPAAPTRSSARTPAGDPIRGGVSRWAVWVAGSIALCVVLVLQAPLLVPLAVLALAVLVGGALAPHRRGRGPSLVALLPAGLVVAFAAVLAESVLAGALGLTPWRDRGTSVSALAVIVALTGVLVWRRGGRVTVVGDDGLPLAGGVVLAGALTWTVQSQPLAVWSRISGQGTDFLRHLGLIRDFRLAGAIIPGEQSYPQSFHAMVGG